GAFGAFVLLATLASTAAFRLRWNARSQLKQEAEWEGTIAFAFTMLGMVLIPAWLIARIDQVFGHGPLPTTLSTFTGIALSYTGPVLVGLFTVGMVYLPRIAKQLPKGVMTPALAILCAALLIILFTPMHPYGQRSGALFPDYFTLF